MVQRMGGIAAAIFLFASAAAGGEKQFISLRGYCDTELRSAGFELLRPAEINVRALGAGGEKKWSGKEDRMFAYGWIINADTRECVWRMDGSNTDRKKDDREFSGTLSLQAGSYEAYFVAWGFAAQSTFSALSLNIDQRKKPLFTEPAHKRGFWSWFSDWFKGDIAKEWKKRCAGWGMDLSINDAHAPVIRLFAPPKPFPRVVVRMTNVGDHAFLQKILTVNAPTVFDVYALGERTGVDEPVDQAWITRTSDHRRIWSLRDEDRPAGGAEKNVYARSRVKLEKGEYVVTYVSDDSHSSEDWNAAPPEDPLNYGVTIAAVDDQGERMSSVSEMAGFSNVILSLVRVGDEEERSEGFTLKQNTRIRIYAIGERTLDRKQMADYGSILDARTRERIWTMDVDRTEHAGGSSKNRIIDETIDLPKGSYLVAYRTDDSHAYGDWNDDPPYDQEHYGITIMGVGDGFSSSLVGKYVEERDRNVVAQIVKARDDEDRADTFILPRTTRVRVYAIGEGQNREMFDYGWIENAETGNVVWEMTYNMTFHAGGGRKNRLVNTTITLEKGTYRLHWKSDDSHSYRNWNVEPPEDEQYWGITVFRDETPPPPPPERQEPPPPPRTPKVVKPPR